MKFEEILEELMKGNNPSDKNKDDIGLKEIK